MGSFLEWPKQHKNAKSCEKSSEICFGKLYSDGA